MFSTAAITVEPLVGTTTSVFIISLFPEITGSFSGFTTATPKFFAGTPASFLTANLAPAFFCLFKTIISFFDVLLSLTSTLGVMIWFCAALFEAATLGLS